TRTGGNFELASATKQTSMREKSSTVWTEPVQSGSYSAALSTPTTAALAPAIGARTDGLARNPFQNGKAATSNRNPGRKIAGIASIAPAIPFGSGPIAMPRKAAKVKSGPGTACAAP